MGLLTFYTDQPVTYNWVGKFEAPNEDWIHLNRPLTDYELIIVTHGVLYISNGAIQHTVRKGEYLIMSPGDNQHGYRSSKCTFYWMHFSQPDFTVSDSSISLKAHAPLISYERTIILLKQLQDSERRYHNKEFDNYLATTIIYEIYCQHLSHEISTNTSRKGTQLYTDIIDYVAWHIWEQIRVSEIANYYGYNEKYLSTFFKKISGVSLKTYILNSKMDLAKSLLTDTNDTISQIGYSIGFQDNHNFSSCFKKITGLSPSQYRESYSQRMLFHK